jgi:lipopolysaccharide/colanic/teichoic acid biosynthesis glycosyltransferase
VLAAVVAVFVGPVLVLVAVCIRVIDGGPVLFSQERTGRDGVPFRIWKFRTMVADRAGTGPGITAGGDHRVTWLGRHLRRLKLDELPQLFNVLNGTMSFVGPRPEVPEYVALYSERERTVLAVRPGLTDPATLRYRNEEALLAEQDDPEAYYRETLMPDKLRMNLQYAANRTVLSDLGVIASTVFALFSPTSPKGEAP